MIRIFTASICLLAAAFEPSSAYSSDPPSSFEQLAQRNQQSRPRGGGKPSGRDPAQAISRMDKDGDGRISKSEFLGPGQAFDRIDADGDGYVTKEEFTAILASAGKASDKLSNHPNAAWYAKLPLILTHTHIRPIVSKGRDGREDWEGTVERAIKEMDENGVQASIIMSPPTPFKDYSYFDEIVRIAKKYPTRFRPSGGGRSLNYRIHNIKPDRVDDGDRAAFIKRAEEIIAKGGVGFGETAALHFSFFDGHPFEETQPDHPLYLLLADLAAKYDVPLDLHVEAVAKKWTVPKEFHKRSPSNPNYVDENLKALERLLAHNPKAKIIWVHLGMDSTDYRSPALTRRLLATYPNLNISITGSQHARKYWLMIGGFRINPEWKDVIVAFPDRFMIGADTFYQPENTDREFPQNIKRASKIVRLPLLPPAVARKVAFENAQRLFKIKLINADDYPLPGGSLQMSRPKGMAGKGKFSEQVEKRMRNMDADGDGRVARSEFTGPPNNFARIDADKDGFLTAQEFDAFLKKAKAHRAGGAQKTKLKQGGGGPIKAPNGKTAAQIIGNSDQDGDGKLSRAEFQGNPRAFPKIDKNKDGLLTKQEFETFWRFLKAKQGG